MDLGQGDQGGLSRRREAIMRESRGNVHELAARPRLNGHCGDSDVGK